MRQLFAAAVSLLFFLVCNLVMRVHSDPEFEYPYFTYEGITLRNNSFADVSSSLTKSEDNRHTVSCYTDIEGKQHRGYWFGPDGTKVPFWSPESAKTGYSFRFDKGITLVVFPNKNGIRVSGMYQCVINTHGFFHGLQSITSKNIYIGLYQSGGKAQLQLSSYI